MLCRYIVIYIKNNNRDTYTRKIQLFIQKINFTRIIVLINLIFYGNKVYVIVSFPHLSLCLCYLT